LISIIVILIVAVLFFFVSKNRNKNSLTPLAGLAFGLILAGILFGENRYLGYGLMGVGVVIAVIDILYSAGVNNPPYYASVSVCWPGVFLLQHGSAPPNFLSSNLVFPGAFSRLHLPFYGFTQ
jgi:hypothetical protein